MSFRTSVEAELEVLREKQKNALWFILIVFLTSAFFTLISETVVLVLNGVMLLGVFRLIRIYFHVRNSVRCPQCGAKLGRILADQGNPDSFVPFLYLPASFPGTLEYCPHCGFDLNTEPDLNV